MQLYFTSRLGSRASAPAAALLAWALVAPVVAAQTGPRRGPTDPEHQPGSSSHGVGPQRNQEHLAQWMNRHSNLPVADQQRALEREPGFRDLSPQVQQRMHDRLTQLNSMPPEKRERIIARTEAMEHLAPDQRQQVRGAMTELSSLPPDRRRVVARTFRELRALPPNERQAALNSDRVRSGLNDSERSTLNNLVSIEPYLPPPASRPTQPLPPASTLR